MAQKYPASTCFVYLLIRGSDQNSHENSVFILTGWTNQNAPFS